MGPTERIDAPEPSADHGVMPKAQQIKFRVNVQQKETWDEVIERHNTTHQIAGEAVIELVLGMPDESRAMIFRQVPWTADRSEELMKYVKEWRSRPLPTGTTGIVRTDVPAPAPPPPEKRRRR